MGKTSSQPSARIVVCPPAERPAALRQLHDRLPLQQQPALAQAISGTDPADEASYSGLLVAPSPASPQHGAFDGVVWVQRVIGNTAVIWVAADNCEPAPSLLRAGADYVDHEQIPLAQLVAGEHDGYCETALARAGFPRFAALLYLFADLPSARSARSPAGDDRTALQFVPRAGQQPQRLGALLEQTYLGTLDCPGLDGVRPMHDVLAGYRAQGQHTPDDWYFVRERDADVGALLLTMHPEPANAELVYMGVIPSARGRGLGGQIVRFALAAAARRGAERLVLAVDGSNAPALRAYEREGFVTWDRRTVYARLQAAAQPPAVVELPPAP